jgi:hypothetical protein
LGSWNSAILGSTYPVDTLLGGGLLNGGLILGLGASTSSITTVCPDWGFFTPLCDAFVWMFYPNTASIQGSLSVLASSTQSKVPWGWWTQISAGVGSVSSTVAATTTALTMRVPHNGVTTTVAIFDIHAAAALIPANVLTLLRTIGGMLIWGLFGMWIWHIVTGSRPSPDV